MARLLLKYGEHEIQIPMGESYIGRAVGCQLRFNDAAISRRHVRVMCTDDGAFVENLSMTNGTKVNGQRLSDIHQLNDGDSLALGHRVLQVCVDESADYRDSGPITIEGPLQDEDEGIIGGDFHFNYNDFGEEGSSEETRRGQGPAGMLAGAGDYDFRNCPKCRAGVRRAEPICPSCGYRWPMGSPSMPTQEIHIKELPKRATPRHLVRVPVIYSSEFLTLDCIARDVGEGGMYISSEILDPVGTVCEITALPDGWPALHFEADVCHVSTEIVNGRPAGFGVSFTSRTAPAIKWLLSVAERKV